MRPQRLDIRRVWRAHQILKCVRYAYVRRGCVFGILPKAATHVAGSLRMVRSGCVFGSPPYTATLVAAPHQWGFARIRHSLRSASWRLMRSECRLCRSGRPVQHIHSSLCSSHIQPRKARRVSCATHPLLALLRSGFATQARR